jgi:hypothetical protein
MRFEAQYPQIEVSEFCRPKKICDVLCVGGGCSDVMGVQESVSLHPRPLLQDPAPFTESGALPEEPSLPNMSVLYIIFGTKVKVVL